MLIAPCTKGRRAGAPLRARRSRTTHWRHWPDALPLWWWPHFGSPRLEGLPRVAVIG